MNIWFTSDTHFGHSNMILKFRDGFSSISEHDNVLVKKWNSLVKPRDVIWHLGDFAFRCEASYVKEVLDSLRGNIKLVPGNHDQKYMNLYFEHERVLVYPGLVSKYRWWLSHPPIAMGELRNKRNLHGHSHGKFDGGENYLDVGVDNHNFFPISLDQVRRHFEKVSTNTTSSTSTASSK